MEGQTDSFRYVLESDDPHMISVTRIGLGWVGWERNYASSICNVCCGC